MKHKRDTSRTSSAIENGSPLYSSLTPYYSESGITLYHADFRDVLEGTPPNHYALSICDPPYGIGETRKVASQRHNSQPFGGKSKRFAGSRSGLTASMVWTGSDYDAERWSVEQLNAIRRVSSDQVIWGGNYYTDLLPASASWLVWDKENGATDFADVELAWTSHQKAARLFKWRWNGLLQEDMKNKEPRIYPGQKPVALMRWILSLFASEGDLIFDPCCGSGPVLRACKDAGYKAVGCDISERALELTAKRLQQEVLAFR